jgi:pyruvyl transferase EpsO
MRSDEMESLKQQLSGLIVDLPAQAPIAYIDLPIHLNIGDLLINQGLEALFASHGRHPDLRLSVYDYESFKHLIGPSHVIVLHGGGNLGDIWEEHEDLRQKVLRDFPSHRIRVFPQTIHFDDIAKARRLATAYSSHNDLKVYVRDRESLEVARTVLGIDCALAPDTAHQLYGDIGSVEPGRDQGRLLFMRRDIEAGGSAPVGGSDWPDLQSVLDRPLHIVFRVAMSLNRSARIQRALLKAWYRYRDGVVSRAVRHFERHCIVATSRLHGAILASLLDIPVEIADNRYGKVSRYCDLWMPNVRQFIAGPK